MQEHNTMAALYDARLNGLQPGDFVGWDGSSFSNSAIGFLREWRATGIDCLATGQTTIIPINAGATVAKTFIPFAARCELIAVTGVPIVAAIIRVGNSVNFDNVAPLLTVPTATALNEIVTAPLAATSKSISLSAAVKVDVQTAATVASVFTINVYLLGMLR